MSLTSALLVSVIAIGILSCEASTAPAAPQSVSGTDAHCGASGEPDCPLQQWMKSTLQPYLRSDDMGRLGAALQELAAHPPTGFPGWTQSADAAARAAVGHDTDAIRAQCKACHDAHRERYRQEHRSAKLF